MNLVDECLFIDRHKYTFQKRLQILGIVNTFIVNAAKIVHIHKDFIYEQTHLCEHFISQKGFCLVVHSTLILCVKFRPSHVVVMSSMAASVNGYNFRYTDYFIQLVRKCVTVYALPSAYCLSPIGLVNFPNLFWFRSSLL